MVIVETEEELEKVKELAEYYVMGAIPLFSDTRLHPAINPISMIALYVEQQVFIIPFAHNEAVNLPFRKNFFDDWKCHSILVPDKKRFHHAFGYPPARIVDVQGIEYFETGKITPESDFRTPLMKKMYAQHHAKRSVANAVPIMELARYFDSYFKHLFAQESDKNSGASLFHHSVVIPTLQKIEEQGMHVNSLIFHKHFPHAYIDGTMVYTEYNPYTTTGRITNKFDGVNYAGLSSQDDTRASFRSRHTDGILVNIDYKSFHPLIIADIIQYTFPIADIYFYLATQIFGTDTPSTEQVKEAKKFAMILMYGERILTKIEFFDKMYYVREKMWEEIQRNGFITSPVGRRIYLKDVENPTSAKVFSYLIQLREMEITMERIQKFSTQFPVILYTYDSVLLDIHEHELDKVKCAAYLLTDDKKYPVRLYTGKDYANMTEIL